MAQENVSPQAVELILADLTKGGLKEVINQDEVRLACKSALRGAGCFAPLDELVFQIVAKALELGSGYLSTGLGSRLSRWITTRPLLAPLLRRIADVCVKERDRNRLKDSLLEELRATPGPPLTLEDEKADLEIVQQFWSGRRFTQLDDALAEILATLQDDLRGRCDELSPRLGWNDGSTDSVVDTIMYNSGAYDFVGRQEDLAFLGNFATSAHRFSWLLLTGDGGEGKSRLAKQFTQEHLPEAWLGGKLSPRDLQRFDSVQWLPVQPTCIVIDYPAQDPVRVRELMLALQRRAADGHYDWPVRVILLERNVEGGWYRELLPPISDSAGLRHSAFSEPPAHLGDEPRRYDRGRLVTPMRPQELLEMMAQRFVSAGFVDAPRPELLWQALIQVDNRSIAGQPCPRPIFAAAITEVFLGRMRRGQPVTAESVADLTRSEILSSMIDRDRISRWEPNARSPAELELHENLLALTSFAYGLHRAGLSGLDPVVGKHLPSNDLQATISINEKLVAAMTRVSNGRFEPLEPDLLGEIHLVDRLTAIQSNEGSHAVQRFAEAARLLGGDQANIVAARAIRDFPELVEALGWLLPDRATASAEPELAIRDARYAIDLAASVPFPVVGEVLDWLDAARAANPKDIDIALACARSAMTLVDRMPAMPIWSYHNDRLAFLRGGNPMQQDAVAVLLRLLDQTAELVEAWPAVPEIQLARARLLYRLAVCGTPYDRTMANIELAMESQTLAWRALELKKGNLEELSKEIVRNLVPAENLTDHRYRPQPAGLAWRVADTEEAGIAGMIFLRHCLMSGEDYGFDSGLATAWVAKLECSSRFRLWALTATGRPDMQIVYFSDGNQILVCGGGAEVFHRLARSGAFKIDSPAAARDFVLMFCGFLRASQQLPDGSTLPEATYQIIESAEELRYDRTPDRDFLAQLSDGIKPISIEPDGEHFRAAVTVVFGRAVYQATLAIQSLAEDGEVGDYVVKMLADRPIAELDWLVGERFDGPFRKIDLPSFARMGGQLLFDAATFFSNLAKQNAALSEQMNENAEVFTTVAAMLLTDPLAIQANDQSAAELGANLLLEAADFFSVLAEKNAALHEQMIENARVFRAIAEGLIKNPLALVA